MQLQLHNSFIKHALFAVLITTKCVMSLLSSNSPNDVYRTFAHFSPIDTIWVNSKDITTIFNTGHVLASFLLTLAVFRPFQKSYLKSIFFVSELSYLPELSPILPSTG